MESILGNLMQYSKPFLTQVIFQANFQIDALKDNIEESIVQLCKEKTGAHLSELKNTNISVLPNQGVETTLFSRWVFKGENLQIVLQTDFLQVINLKYTTHADYHPIIDEVFNKVRETYKPIFTRIALRYINNIRFSEGATFDFNNLINDTLLKPTLDYKEFGLTRSIGVMNIHDQHEDINTTFTYGFVNPEFPNKIAKRDFILDYDCFIVLNVTIDSIKPFILKLRNTVNALFEKSILPDLRIKMEQI